MLDFVNPVRSRGRNFGEGRKAGFYKTGTPATLTQQNHGAQIVAPPQKANPAAGTAEAMGSCKYMAVDLGRTRKIISAKVIPWDAGKGTWGVHFQFDDGHAEDAFSGPREQAEWDAHDRIGDEYPVGVNPLLRPIEKMEALKRERSQRN